MKHLDLCSGIGGFPCQPYSCAGKRLGAEDDRAIWPLVIDVVRRVKPHWCVFENVVGFVEMALDGVLADLEAEGYEVGTVVLPACAVNAPHRRDRVWIVAHAESVGSGTSRQEIDKSRRTNRIGGSCQSLADANRSGLEGRSGDELCERTRQWTAGTIGSFPDADRQPSERLAEPRRQRGGGIAQSRLGRVADGLPGGMDRHFDREPEHIPRVARGVKDRVSRLKALGNAIVPQVAFEIFSAIGEAA